MFKYGSHPKYGLYFTAVMMRPNEILLKQDWFQFCSSPPCPWDRTQSWTHRVVFVWTRRVVLWLLQTSWGLSLWFVICECWPKKKCWTGECTNPPRGGPSRSTEWSKWCGFPERAGGLEKNGGKFFFEQILGNCEPIEGAIVDVWYAGPTPGANTHSWSRWSVDQVTAIIFTIFWKISLIFLWIFMTVYDFYGLPSFSRDFRTFPQTFWGRKAGFAFRVSFLKIFFTLLINSTLL